MPINVNYKNPIIGWMKSKIQHYNHDKYWRWREFVTNPNRGGDDVDNQIFTIDVCETL